MMDLMVDHALQMKDCHGVELLPGEQLTDSDCVDDVVILIDDKTNLYLLFDRLAESASILLMLFVPSEYKTGLTLHLFVPK